MSRVPYYHLPHTDGRTIWLRRSRRLEPVRDRQRETPETPEPVEPVEPETPEPPEPETVEPEAEDV